MQDKIWQLFPKVNKGFINKFPEVHPVILQLLYNRKIDTQKRIDEFLSPDYSRDLADPFIFKEMEKACERIEKAVKDNEKILVWGDYDADGVSSTVMMVSTLEKMGAKNIDIHIPLRDEGYGMNLKKTQEFIDKGVNLIVTVDCGVSNHEEIDLANKNNVDVVVTDHHQEPEKLPEKAHAVINPQLSREKYPFKDLSGTGVAFKVIQALVKRNNLGEAFEKWLLDLVAIGTVADCMPLLGENRTMVKYGMTVLRKTSRIGIREVVKKMGANLEKLDAWQISWQLGPRINATGRIEKAIFSYELLKTDDKNLAVEYAERMERINIERQKMTDIIMTEIREDLDLEKQTTEDRVLFAYGRDWPIGLVGLVAGKLQHQYYRPFFVIAKDHGKIKGSGRSTEGLNITDVLKEVSDLLSSYGGHEAACGFTLKDPKLLDEFKKRVSKVVAKKISDEDIAPILEIDAQVDLEDVTWDLYEILDKFSPYGEENWRPRYLAEDLEIMGISKLGKDKTHLRLLVKHNSDQVRKVIGFKFGDFSNQVRVGDKIDMVFEVGVNEWNGNRELEIKLVDIRKRK